MSGISCLVWSSHIKPNLVELLEASEKEHRQYNRREDLNTRYQQYRTAWKDAQTDGLGPLLSFADLTEKEAVKVVLADDSGKSMSLTEDKWNGIKALLPHLISANAQQIESTCKSVFADAISNVGDPSPGETHGERGLESALAFLTVNRPYNQIVRGKEQVSLGYFMSLSGHWGIETYEDIKTRIRTQSLEKWRDFYSLPQFYRMARTLLKSLEISQDVNMAYMVALGSPFRCDVCHRNQVENSQLTWKELVSISFV